MGSLIEFSGCDTCSLKQEWPFLQSPRMPMTVPTESSPYRILFLGEGPGAEEDEKGKQFVGRTGQLLRKYIPDVWKNKIYFQNVVRCRPPRNRPPMPQEIACCSTYLERDISTIRPHVILGLGEVALSYFWPGMSISKIRGIPFPVQVGKDWCWFWPEFHPSYVYRSDRTNEDGQIVNPVKPVFRNDLLTFFALAQNFTNPPDVAVLPQKICYPKSAEEAESLIRTLEEPFGIDFETSKLKPYMRDARILTVALSDGKTTLAFPVLWPGDLNPWGLGVLRSLLKSGRKWVAHNASFELCWALSVAKGSIQTFDDTEVLARLIHMRRGTGKLSLVSRVHLGFDVKELTEVNARGDLTKYPLERVLEYNALDAWACHEIYVKLSRVLPEAQRDNYQRTLNTVKSTVAMELVGLDIDFAESERHSAGLQKKMIELEEAARHQQEVREYEQKEAKSFHLSSPQAVASVLTRYCGIQLPKTEKGNYTTDDDILEKLAGQHPVVDLTRDFREVQKLKSTYVDPILTGEILGVDRRLHPSYKAIHTATYRLSSEDPNIQNFPKRKHKEIRSQIVAQKGYVLAAFDYGQLEVRVLAMASNDPVLKASIINNDDIHSKWLNHIIDRYPLYLDRLAEKTGQKEEAKIRKAGRDIIKTDFVFASFYGSHAKSIAGRTGMPYMQAQEFLDDFWQEYKGVRSWIDRRFEEYENDALSLSLTGRIRDEVLPGNEPINNPIQGTGAEIVLEAQNALYFKSIADKDAAFMPRINVHDDLEFILPDSDDLEQYIRTIGKEIVMVRFPFITVPLMTECKIGQNWANLEFITQFVGDYIQ